jgi:hypothetical protein
MSWTRLPTFFPNFSLRMLPLAPEAAAQLKETGWVREVAFRTEPRVTKVRPARPSSREGPAGRRHGCSGDREAMAQRRAPRTVLLGAAPPTPRPRRRPRPNLAPPQPPAPATA